MQRVLWVAALLTTVFLAGCADESGTDDETQPPTAVDTSDTTQLKEGRGAIAGLLIDDAFRPIANGTILLQELGETTQSNAQGEFFFLDLKPATYTLRINVDGHEAIPQKVKVVEGEFAEAQVMARRVANQEGVILTQEFTIFIPCATSFVAATATYNCASDLSGESYRPGLQNLDYMDLNVTFAVFEMKTNQEDNFLLAVRHDDGSALGGEEYGEDRTEGTDYARVMLQNGTNLMNTTGSVEWHNDKPLAALLFFLGEGGQELEEAGCTAGEDEETCRGYFGAGQTFAIEAQIIVTLFLGDPPSDVDPLTHQVLEGEP